MRERHIFWDIAPVALLALTTIFLGFIVFDNHRSYQRLVELKRQQEDLFSQNRQVLNLLQQGARTAAALPLQNTATKSETTAGRRPAGFEDLPEDVEIPAMHPDPHGDENADDGDWLVDADIEDPKSLNPLVDNSANIGDLFGNAHDTLAGRAFQDLSHWEPRLARAWRKELLCLVYPKDGNAESLAAALNRTWDAELKMKLQIRRIRTVDGGGRPAVCIEVGAMNNDYRESLKRDFGPRVYPQWWFYVTFSSPGEFVDGKLIVPEAVAQRLIADVKRSGFKGEFLSPVCGSDRVVLRLLGDEKQRDALEETLRKIEASAENKCMVFDTKETSGKREDQLLRYEQLEDYLAQEKPVFTFYLRKDAKWHDGKPFSGRDVVWTYKTIMDPRIECGHYRNYLQDLESVELVDQDPHVVRFTWFKPYFNAWADSAGFTALSEAYYRYDDPKEFNTGENNQSLVGNGEWRLDKWERQREMVFVRNEDYYGRKPHFKRLVVRFIKDLQVQLQLFEDGKLDTQGLLPSQMKSRENDPAFNAKFNINISIASNYRFVGWNARKPIFADKRVRQALTMLIDRDRICSEIQRGYAIPQHNTVHPENPAYWKDQPRHAWPFDPERARRQLTEIGWKDADGDGVLDKDGLSFRFTLLIPASIPEYEAMANLMKASFAKVGIDMSVNNLEWSAFTEKLDRLQFDAVSLGWRLGAGEEDPYQLWHSSQADEKESNFCNFRNKEADRLIEECRRELNAERRYRKLARFQEIVNEEQPYTFLFVGKRLVAYDKRIQNVQFRLAGSNSNRWWVPQAQQKYKD